MRALIIGRATGVWEEVEQAKQLCSFDSVTLTGIVGVNYPYQIDHWVTWHWNLFPDWVEKRKKLGFPPAAKYWSGEHHKRKAMRRREVAKFPVELNYVDCEGGSSGLLAIMVNLPLAERIVLAGIPMMADREHVDQPGPWKDAKNYYKTWEKQRPLLGDKVRSMSGWTAELLGVPTTEWLNNVACDSQSPG